MIYTKINLLNCWNSILIMNTNLKLFQLQRKDEISLSVNCRETRKKNERDDLWLNPKGYENGESAAKPRTEEGSETIESIT